jgi:hypothetical protein
LLLRRSDCYSLSLAVVVLFAVNDIFQITAGFDGLPANIMHRVAALAIMSRSQQFADPCGIVMQHCAYIRPCGIR